MRALYVVVPVAIIVASGCSTDPGSGPRLTAAQVSAQVSATQSPQPSASPHDHAASVPSHATLPQLAAQFDQLLGEHTILVIRQMRSVITPTLSGQGRAYVLLQQNSDALTKQVVATYGSKQGAAYKKVWDGHIQSLFDYANGILSKDKSARDNAHRTLLRYCDEYGAWLATASKGAVSAAAGSAGVRMHVEDLIAQIDAYSAKDYATAYRIERQAYEHMFAAGTGLATSSVRPEQAVVVHSPPAQLRSTLAMLLGEHMQLVIDAQRAAFAGSPEFPAAATQLDANTTALSTAIAAVAGPAGADTFSRAWAGHVDALIAYARAVAHHDERGRAAVGGQMALYARRLSALLAGLVQNRIPAATVVDALTTHDAELITQLDAYSAKNYTRAEQVAVDGYEHILGVADLLATAIEKTVHAQLPTGAAQTGGGSTARQVR